METSTSTTSVFQLALDVNKRLFANDQKFPAVLIAIGEFLYFCKFDPAEEYKDYVKRISDGELDNLLLTTTEVYLAESNKWDVMPMVDFFHDLYLLFGGGDEDSEYDSEGSDSEDSEYDSESESEYEYNSEEDRKNEHIAVEKYKADKLKKYLLEKELYLGLGEIALWS